MTYQKLDVAIAMQDAPHAHMNEWNTTLDKRTSFFPRAIWFLLFCDVILLNRAKNIPYSTGSGSRGHSPQIRAGTTQHRLLHASNYEQVRQNDVRKHQWNVVMTEWWRDSPSATREQRDYYNQRPSNRWQVRVYTAVETYTKCDRFYVYVKSSISA